MTSSIEFAVLEGGPSRLELGWKPRKKSVRRESRESWLKVHGRVRSPDGEWCFRDSSLMVEEAERLCEWLHVVSAGELLPAGIEFLEPCLSFAAISSQAGRVVVRARFRGEASPPWLWIDDHATWSTGYWLSMDVSPDQVRNFAHDVEGLLGRA